MPSKTKLKNAAIAARSAALPKIPQELLDQLVQGPMAVFDSNYAQAKDTREVVDIAQLNAELKTTVAKIDQLRKDIDAIVAEIEGGQQRA